VSNPRKPHPVDIHVGARVYHLRQRAGVSRTHFAALSGVTFQQLQKYEKGENRMSVGRLWDFSRILDLPISDFFVGLPGADVALVSSTPELDAVTAILGTGAGLDFLECLPRLDEPMVQGLARMARFLAEGDDPATETAASR